MRLNEGNNCIRILPDKKDIVNGNGVPTSKYAPFREYYVHYQVRGDTYACGRNLEGKGKCWLCEEIIPMLRKSNLEDAKEAARRMARKKVFLVQACRYENGKFSSQPAEFSVPTGRGGAWKQKSLAERVLRMLINSNRKDYLDPIQGYNLIIERSGTGLKSQYPSIGGDESPTRVPKAILRKMVDLDALVPVYDEDAQWHAYYAGMPLANNDEFCDPYLTESGRKRMQRRSTGRGG